MKQPIISWNEYPVISLFTALMLVILGFSDGFYLVIPTALFFFLTGVKSNAKILIGFAKRYWYLLVIMAVTVVYDLFMNRTWAAGKWLTGAIAVLIGGFFVATNCRGDTESAYHRFWVFLFAIVALGVVKNVINGETGYFLSDEADLFATIIFACITILFVGQKHLKVAGVMLSLLSAAVLWRRGAFHILRMAAIPDLLKEFGSFSCVLCIGVLICTIRVFMGNRARDLKKQSILACAAIVAGVLLQITGSVNTKFLLFLILGMFIGRYTYTETDVQSRMETKILSRSDYFYMGLTLAVLMSGRDEFRDGTWQLILAGLFFVLTGVRENVRMLLDFVRRFPLYAAFTLIWIGYFFQIRKPDLASYRYPVVVFAIVFCAYCVAQEGEAFITEAFRKMWMVLLAALVICDVNYVLQDGPRERMHLFFLNANIEGYAIIAFLLISLFLIKHPILQKAGALLAVVSSVLTGSKACTLIAAAGVLYLFALYMKRLTGLSENRYNNNVYIMLAVAVFCVVLAGSVLMKQEDGALARLLNRYLQAIRDIRIIADGSQAVDYSSSTYYRIYVIKTALENITKGSFAEVAIGRGLLQQYYHVLQPVITFVYSLSGTKAGPAENTFLSLMHDYGAASFVLLLGTFVSALIAVFRSKHHLFRKTAATLAGMLLLVATVDMEYYINVIFIIWIFIGVCLGIMDVDEKRRFLVPSMIFCSFLIPVVYLLPAANTYIKTLLDGNSLFQESSYHSRVLFSVIATAVGVIAIMIVLCMLIAKIVYERHASRMLLIASGAACVFLATGLISGNQLIRDVTLVLDERMQKEADVIQEIKEHSSGKLYASAFPEIYENAIGGFSRSVFSGAELVCYDKVTIVTDIGAESNSYGRKGFLFLPVSEVTAIYTNDDGVINYFREKGEWLTGYNPYVHRVDVSQTDNAKDVSVLIYQGIHTMTFDLTANPGAKTGEQEIGAITILPEALDAQGADREAKPIFSKTISGAEFDAKGQLKLRIKCNIPSTGRVHVLTEGGEAYDLQLNEITYGSTPDYDTHYQVNQYGEPLLEAYYDLEGKPYQLPKGYYGVRNEYDDARYLIRQEYLDKNLEPFIVPTMGYAVLLRTYNEEGRIARESYYDTEDQPLTLPAGQAAVEYEYDEAGNRSVTRYYDVSNGPVLYNGQYWYVNVTYNEKKQNVLEMYYGIDGKPVLRPDGAAGYRREYNEEGNISCFVYLDADGNPTTNTSGYATWRRTYNDKKQIVRESYYDAEDVPVALTYGQAAEEYEYDETGNRTVTRYYDVANEPVLYNGQYWYVDVTYNEKKQNVLEMYYGIDGKPILRPNGAAGYRREYDEEGNNNCATYLDREGNPTINTSGYTTWRRAFNDKKQIVRESYYDTEDQPVALEGGQAAVEYEYDEVGNRTALRYYDAANEPVLFDEQYWCRKIAYNEKKQVVREEYYDTKDEPVETADGYTVVVYEYDEDGEVSQKAYYDLEGREVVLDE